MRAFANVNSYSQEIIAVTRVVSGVLGFEAEQLSRLEMPERCMPRFLAPNRPIRSPREPSDVVVAL